MTLNTYKLVVQVYNTSKTALGEGGVMFPFPVTMDVFFINVFTLSLDMNVISVSRIDRTT